MPSSTTGLLARLRDLDVKIWVEGERLRINAPRDVLTEELRAELAEHKVALTQLLGTAPGAGAEPAAHDGATAPLSFSQQRLWFLDQLRPNSPEYNIPGATRLVGRLQRAALERAITTIVERHDALRTHFDVVAGTPVQVIEPPSPFELAFQDLRRVPAAERESHAMRLLRVEAARPFDLARAPLLRATLYQLGEEEHLLLCVIHHIVSDGWSAVIFVQELGALYAAFVEGRPSPLPALPMQYADYARQQQRWAETGALARELDYWRNQLGNLGEALELPTDHPRPPVQTANGALETLAFPAELMEQIETLGRREGLTPFMILLAAFASLLARYSGQDDIVVGTPIANRTRVEVEPLIGFFANTLVLRTDLSGDPTFRELAKRVREVALGAYAHQEVPFERIVEAVHPTRDMSRAPLFQVLFALQNLPNGKLNLPGLTLEPVVLHSGAAQTDVSLHVGRNQVGYAMALEYNTDLFEATTIRALGEHLVQLLEEVVRDPGQRILDIPILPESERRRLLLDWNTTGAAVPAAAGVHELVAERAACRADAVAAVFNDQALTYGELQARARTLAVRLRSLGVRPGTLVALCTERSLDMLVGLLGILNAGGAYVPLDPAYPADRLSFMLEDARCPVLVTQSHLLATLPPHGAHTVLLDDDSRPTAHDGDVPDKTACADDPAYVIFTSGSTGKPKGVQIPHRALLNLLASMAREPGLGPDDVLLAVTTLSFDIAGLELFLPLMVGARIVLASREAALDPAKLAGLIVSEGVTAMQATPATWRMLSEHGWRGPRGFRILCGGEALPPDLAQTLASGEAEAWNLYGPTETTIWSTVQRLTPGSGPVPIGRPIANTRVYVLDPRGAPTPTGVPGELYIGGMGVALGYLNRPELTAERFLPDPFAGEADARMYRTGDRVRWRADGTLEYLGRLDTQVKIRGFRVELGEIEMILGRHSAVKRAVAHVLPDSSGTNRLVAYVVPAGTGLPAPAELRSHLAAQLPEYMVPSVFMPLNAIPLTPNGKVDRRRLPPPDVQRLAPDSSRIAPRNDVERTVARVWCEALGVPSVSMTDNFFDLGGHSLLIVKVHTELRAALDHDLSIVEMFQYPTVRALADRIARRPSS
jgi:amino acid adenylation domain-containing protein